MTNKPEGLKSDLDAFKAVHEAQVIGLAAKHDIPAEQVAEECARVALRVMHEIEDASTIIVTHATTPTPDIPITIIESPIFTDTTTTHTNSQTPPFLLQQTRLIETPAVLTEYDIYDADANPENKAIDARILAPNSTQTTLNPESDTDVDFDVNPDQIPISFMDPTPGPEDRYAYQHLAAQTLRCPPPFVLNDTNE